jgi:hypothetical protein
MTVLLLLIASMLSGAGLAIVLTEQRYDWPVRNISIPLRRFLQVHVHRKMHRVLKCCICTSFWTGMLCYYWLAVITGAALPLLLGTPLAGFACAGLVWTLFTYAPSTSN